MLHIGGDFVAALDTYVQAVADVVPKAHAAGISTFQDGIRRRAALHPRWASIADHIESWSDDSSVHVGIRNPDLLDSARDAEYGDDKSAPAPLMRHNPLEARKAAERMDDVLHSHLGIPRHQ